MLLKQFLAIHFLKIAFLMVNSGRYEFRNKGVDIFIDSLGELKKKDNIEKECVAFILMPAYHKGPRQDIIDILYNNGPGKRRRQISYP